MSMRTRGRSRLAALGIAGALAAATLAIAPPATAAPADVVDGAVLDWGTSRYLNEHLTDQQFADGASEATDGTVRFTGGAGSVDADTRTATVSYRGSASYAFSSNGVKLYGVTLADPAVEVAPNGNGRIVADVSWFAPGAAGSADDVVVTTFTGEATRWNRSVIQATPVWDGAVPADSYGTAKPVNGQSWAKDLVDVLPGSVKATFYSSGTNPTSDAKKAPAPFTAQYAAMPSVTPTVVAASYADGVDVRVAGSGFSAATAPGDAGVYVGVAPADAVIDFDDRVNGTQAMVAVDWVAPGAMADGSFVKGLNLPTAKLTPGTSYAVFTWQAHTHSNTTQDTLTPFAIDWRALAAPQPTGPATPAKITPRVAAKVAKAPTARKAGRAMVTVKGARGVAAGRVRAQVLKGTKGAKVAKRLATVRLVKGRATLRLPKLARGTYRLKVVYLGSGSYRTKGDVVRFRVRVR